MSFLFHTPSLKERWSSRTPTSLPRYRMFIIQASRYIKAKRLLPLWSVLISPVCLNKAVGRLRIKLMVPPGSDGLSKDRLHL